MIKKGTKIGWLLVAASILLLLWIVVFKHSSAADNEAFSISNGVLTKYDESKMTGTTPYTVEIPSEVTVIGRNAFSNMKQTARVNMGDSVTKIEGGAFANSQSLTQVTLSNAITEIPTSAFQETGITTISIPSNVNTIGALAFANTELTSITIPANVSTIANNAFSDNQNLSAINVDASNSTFESVNESLII